MNGFLANHPALAIAVIIALGSSAQWLAWRMRLPAILPLLTIGFVVGPLLGWLRPLQVFGADLLYPAVSMAVALVLFEGGLTLRFADLQDTKRVVINLVTVGAIVTWLCGSAAAYWLVGLPLSLSLLFGALVLVTGPTVIGPLLRIVRPNARVAAALRWESIVIDVVGAMVAVLVFEGVKLGTTGYAVGHTVLLMLRFILVGTVTGALGGAFLAWLLRRRAIPDYLINVTSLAIVFGAFAVANTIAGEAGLLTTVVMGVMVANLQIPNLDALLSFKEDLTVLFVSMLFIVLAADIDLVPFVAALNLPSLLVLALLVIVVRPLDVFLSSIGSRLELREKIYISWLAPRGIVAAAVSSLFASQLVRLGIEGADRLVPLVFMVIVGTVLLASLTAKPLGVWLGVADPDPQGFLILGAHPAARAIATVLKEHGIAVQVADTNWANVAAARAKGIPAYFGSLLSDRSDDELRLSGIGRFLALTSNDEANALTAVKFAREFGSKNVYQIAPASSQDDRRRLGGDRRGLWFGSAELTFQKLQALLVGGARFQSIAVTEDLDIAELIASNGDGVQPLFVVRGKRLEVLSDESPEPESGSKVLALVAEHATLPRSAIAGDAGEADVDADEAARAPTDLEADVSPS